MPTHECSDCTTWYETLRVIPHTNIRALEQQNSQAKAYQNIRTFGRKPNIKSEPPAKANKNNRTLGRKLIGTTSLTYHSNSPCQRFFSSQGSFRHSLTTHTSRKGWTTSIKTSTTLRKNRPRRRDSRHEHHPARDANVDYTDLRSLSQQILLGVVV